MSEYYSVAFSEVCVVMISVYCGEVCVYVNVLCMEMSMGCVHVLTIWSHIC